MFARRYLALPEKAHDLARGAAMTEESVFQEALSRSPAERAAFLEQACAGQPQLRYAVHRPRFVAGLLGFFDSITDKPMARAFRAMRAQRA
jgi:hypothetical protein